MRHILFLHGIEDSNCVEVHSVTPEGTKYAMQGNIDLYRDLGHPGMRLHTAVLGGLVPQVPVVRRPHIVFNCISDADTNRKALALAIDALLPLGLPVLNDPARVLETRRDDVAKKLAGIPGMHIPVTQRIVPQSHREILDTLANGPVRYPALLRRAGTHGGVSMLLLRSAADAPLLERIACDGSDYYLIEFVDFRSADGYYRKMRLVVIDGQVYARHLLVGNEWNVHASARDSVMVNQPAFAAEEEQFLAAFNAGGNTPWRSAIAEIHRRLGLDYFSIDATELANGSLLMFEANASGNALRQKNPNRFPYLAQHVLRLREAVIGMLLRPR